LSHRLMSAGPEDTETWGVRTEWTWAHRWARMKGSWLVAHSDGHLVDYLAVHLAHPTAAHLAHPTALQTERRWAYPSAHYLGAKSGLKLVLYWAVLWDCLMAHCLDMLMVQDWDILSVKSLEPMWVGQLVHYLVVLLANH